MRLLPRSLFGRTLLVLAAGLILAQLGSMAIHLFDRGSSVYRLASLQIAARIGQAARTLNRLPASERHKVVEEISGPHLRVALSERPVAVERGFAEHDPYEKEFTESVQRQIGARWPIRVDINPTPRRGARSEDFDLWMARHFYFLLPEPFSIVVQIGLQDGTVAVFDVNVPQEPLSRLESLVPLLLLLLLVCFALAAFLVRMTNRSLDRLARAADAIGRDPAGASLAESGPSEVRRVVAAFNRMQERVRRYLIERGQLLSAISHDLKTPITRLRLRAELLPDVELRAKMLRDLDEMQTMVGATLDFFSSVGKGGARQPVDIGALIESVCEDRREAGQTLSVEGAPLAPYRADPQALRRCIENLVGNAVRYGGAAELDIEDDAKQLRISVRDHGPGVPEQQLERVFEPYYRIEASRNRASGGTGLGLSIARNIARWHGGDIRLRNAPGGGLIAQLTLPR